MDYQKLSDEELVLSVQQHNGTGFEEIIDRYQGRLLRYVGTICWDQESAEDIVQETFISAYQNINSFDTRRKFSSWIYRIAHNKAINELRKAKSKVSLDDIAETPSEHDDKEIIRNIDQKEMNAKVRKVIYGLPAKYREPLILRHYEERSYEEISDILKIPVSTVGVRIKRGLDKVTKLIEINPEDYL